MFPRGRVLLVFIFLSLMIGKLTAQNAVSTGAISGIVTDTTGAVIPNVQVDLTNTETGIEMPNRTNGTGLYSYPTLSVGIYSARFTATGFKTGLIPSVTVSIGRTSSAGIQLEVGTANQQVTVTTSTSPLLDTSDSSVSTTVNRELIRDLPSSGRNYTGFVLLTPNVNQDGEFGDVSFAGQQGSGSSGLANGNGTNSFTVDGAAASSSFYGGARGRTRVPYVFGEESIQEFQVSDNPYSAAYGGAGSGFVNTVTKSGTNKIHGEAFYFNRNSAFANNDAIDKAAGRATPYNVLQQFGANAGGPIRTNKLFYFFDYEQSRNNMPMSIVNTGMSSLDVTSFGLPAGTVLPAPNAAFPAANPNSTNANANASNPIYLQQVANALHVIQSNLGTVARRQNDLLFFPKVDWQASQKDHLTFHFNYNKFDGPGDVVTYNPVSFGGIEVMANNYVRDYDTGIHWTHTFSNSLLNDTYMSYTRDTQSDTPSGLAPSLTFPTVMLFSPQFFMLGNPGFAESKTPETEYQFNDHVTYVRGRHTISTGLDFTHDSVNDFEYGNFRGTYAFTSPENFALVHELFYSQSGGNPTYSFSVPYVGFYLDDKYQIAKNLTLDLGLREDFQVFPQPAENTAFPQTGKFPNEYQRFAPRFGFAWSPYPKTVVRGGFGVFYTDLNGVNYEGSALSNGLASQQSSLFLFRPPINAPTFPNQISNASLFAASPNISVFSSNLKPPTILESNLQIEQAINDQTTFSLGAVWSHANHLIASSAYDMNLIKPTGTTTYIVCPKDTPETASSCNGSTYVEPNLDSGLLTEGAINPNLGQINALISPGHNNYISMISQVTRRAKNGLSVLSSFTFAKNINSNGVDFNNQFDFSNTHGPSNLDQRIRLSIAAVYQPVTTGISNPTLRRLAENWTISTITQFNSGRPYTGTLNPACTGPNLQNCNGSGDNLNDSAFNESTSNTALGIAGAGPSPNLGYNSFYGPWIDEADAGIERRFIIHGTQYVSMTAQVFNLTNHQNYFVQAQSGVQTLQYSPVGNNCGDGASANQTCYLVPNTVAQGSTSPFGQLEAIDQLNPPRVWQFAARYTF